MCGIFGYIGSRNDAPAIVLSGLKSLEYRGYDSWGVAVVDAQSGTIPHIALKKKQGKIGTASVSELSAGSLALGHTRWATHGGVTDANAHPHVGCRGNLALVHNGIFENYETMKRKILGTGHVVLSQTDSEVAVHLIEDRMAQGKTFIDAVRETFLSMEGLNALIVMDASTRTLVAVRNGSPLVIGFGAGEYFIASDASALLPYTRKVYFLKDNEMAVLHDAPPEFFSVRTRKSFRPEIQTLEWTQQQTEKGAYPYFMLKEIHEQPAMIRAITEKSAVLSGGISDRVAKSDDVYLVGCGSAFYASVAGTYLFSTIAHRQAVSVVGSEFGYQLEFLKPTATVVAISQSGETMDILESVKKAKGKRAGIIALVNAVGSSLYRESDGVIPIGAGPERSVASTKALTGMIAHLILFTHTLAGSAELGKKRLAQAAEASESVLSPENVLHIRELAKHLAGVQHIYCIGRGLSYVASMETAMKIKEISYIHAEGMAAGELKHGSLALVSRGTPCIVFLPRDETYGANLAGAMEMKARGGYIIGISDTPHELFDAFLPVPYAHEATIIPNIITAQMLAYELTMELGLDPDMPRNLAKSVTVK